MSFVVKAAKKVVNFVGDVVSGVVKAVGNVISAVVDFVVSPFMGLFGIPDAPSDAAEAERQQGVLIQTQGSNVPVPVIYGYRKVAGTVTFAETGATNNKYLWVAYTIAEGGVEGIRELFIDDNQLDEKYIAKLNTGQAVTITDGKYANRVLLQVWGDGYKDASAYTNFGNNSICSEAPSWDNSYTYNGLLVVFARYEWKEIQTQEDADNNPFSGNIPVIQVSVLGRRVASLVTSTSENYEYGAVGYTERYSTNPAEILLDYLRNPRYGKGLVNSEIDWDSFRKAAAKCNQTVEYISGVQGPILTTNYVLNTGQTIFNNVKILLTNMRGYLPYVQGKYKLRIEDAGDDDDILSGVATIVKTFNKDNIIGSITYTGIDRNAKYNQVVVKYVDPDNKWSVQEVVYPETEEERLQYQVVDGNRENKADITFPACTNYAIAKDFARLIFNKSRYQDTVSFTADSSAFELEPGDNVYIDANILKFGTDPNEGAIPWRIVSIKLNNNYTFDIGCVRNPDFIYPHTRVGEIDVVLPPYIPKGATITYPGNPGLYPVGLVPPTNVVTNPDDEASRPGNGGGATDPTEEDGGGVGAPDGPINQDPIANPPPAPPSESEYDDFTKIDKVVYTTVGGSIYADVTVKQPGNGAYHSLYVWWKRSISSETVWEFKEITDRPGEGNNITFRIGPFISGFTYQIKTRVKYSDGTMSKIVVTSPINPKSTGSEDPVDYSETVSSGWTLNTEAKDLVRNTYIRSLVGEPLLTGGSPRTPRAMNWTIVQEIYNIPTNGYIAGLNIYYKPSVNKYWNKSKISFDGSYQEGSAYSFDLPFGLGSPGTYQLYDFVIRFRYTDGTEAEVQHRAMGVRVESDPFGQYDFDPFYIVRPYSNESVNAYSLITVDNAPPGAVSDPRDMKFSFNAISNDFDVEHIYFRLDTPSAADQTTWLGAKIYYKEVLETPTSIQSTTISPADEDVVGYFLELDVNYDSVYEYVIVPLVDYNGTTTEGSNAWYFSGYIHERQLDDDYPTYGNWIQQFIREQSDFATAYAKFGTAEPAGPVLTTKVDSLFISEVVDSDPREVEVTLTQLASTTGNGRISGLNIYYKPSQFDYWFQTSHTFSGYTEGNEYTFAFDGDLGALVAGTLSYRQANYDFIFRWVYDNGEEGIYQVRAMEVQVQDRISDYEAFGSPKNERVDSYSLITVDNAPPGAVPDARDLTISFDLDYHLADLKSQALWMYVNQPVDPLKKWSGIRLYYRKVVPGSNPSYTINDFLPVSKDTIGRLSFKQAIEYDVAYEFVIVPIVSYNRSKTECNQAWYGRGSLHSRLEAGRYPDFFNRLGFELVDTDIALGRLKEVFEQEEPTVQIKNWKFINTNGASADPSNSYLELEFYHQHIDGYLDCTVYRRQRDPYSLGLPRSDYAKYWGYGQWEKVTVTETNYTAGGTVTVKLRAPVSSFNFNYNKLATISGTTSTNGLWNSLYYNYSTNTANPLMQVGLKEGYEYIIVARTSAGVSTKGIYLKCLDSAYATSSYDLKQRWGPGETVTVDDYNGFVANWKRNISEAVTSYAANTLKSQKNLRVIGITLPSGVV